MRTDSNPSVAVVKPTQDRCGNDPASRLTGGPGVVFAEVIWDLLSDTLMGSGVVVVFNIGLNDAMQLAVMQNEHVVETFSFQAANETFAE